MGEYMNTRRVVAIIRSHAFKHAPPEAAGNLRTMEKKRKRKIKKTKLFLSFLRIRGGKKVGIQFTTGDGNE
jgi:hypothetical protein